MLDNNIFGNSLYHLVIRFIVVPFFVFVVITSTNNIVHKWSGFKWYEVVCVKGCRMCRSDTVSLWYVLLLINTRFRFFILE